MAKRKRREVDSAAKVLKRQKATRSTAPEEAANHSGSASADVDLTALNAINSPLLRLPAELRNTIWQYAFGGQMAVVSVREGRKRHGQLAFRTAIYDAVCKYHDIADEVDISAAPQPLSRQFWAEASKVFTLSCTFRFDFTASFKVFAESGLRIVALVRRILITTFQWDWFNWFELEEHSRQSATFTPYAVGRFQNLEGVRLVLDVPSVRVPSHIRNKLLGSSVGQQAKAPIPIQAFQQHRLKPEYTSVTLMQELRFHLRTQFREGLTAGLIKESFQKHLLNHKPLRLSRRVSQRTNLV